jgi:hypothetical protein
MQQEFPNKYNLLNAAASFAVPLSKTKTQKTKKTLANKMKLQTGADP